MAAVSRSRKLAVWSLPLAIVIGFIILFAILFRDRLLPAKEVRVVAAMAMAVDQGTASTLAVPESAKANARMLFQASGWIEPDPFPIRATALTGGVISEVFIREGELVEVGTPLATLISEDARLMRDAMASEIEMKQAEFDAHCVEVQTQLQVLAGVQAALTQAEAAIEEAADRVNRLDRSPAAASTESERVSARLDLARRKAAAAIAEARIREISWDFNRIAYETLAHHHGLEIARNKLAEAELNLQRTNITAPINGRILRLLAAPGQKKMLGMDDLDSATIALLYDPEKLQVRVDVPLADAAALAIGQRTRIRCGLLPDSVFDGEVTRIAGEADIQRNTLQAKVQIHAPDARLRPEMICRVEFLDTVQQQAGTSPTASGDLTVFIPESAIHENAIVWVCDPETRRAEARQVAPTRDIRDGWLRLASGIRPGEWIIDDPAAATLKPGQRVHPNLTP